MSCLALSEDLAQKKHPSNELPWKHHNHRVCQNLPHGRITDVLINTSIKKISGAYRYENGCKFELETSDLISLKHF
jgi:hypothetical protein